MSRSWDSRRHPSGPPEQKVTPLRGPKRTGPIRGVVPGDDVEVAREIARLWEWISRLNRTTAAGSNGCCVPGDGTSGPVTYVGEIDYVQYVKDLGATAFYRLGDSGWSTASGETVGAAVDSSAWTYVMDLSLFNTKTGTYNTWIVPGDDTNVDLFDDDGSIALNTVPASVAFGSYQGAALSMLTGASLGQKSKFEITANKLSGMAYVKPQACGVSGYISQIFGTWGTYDGGSTESGFAILWDEDNSSILFRAKNGAGTTYSISAPVAVDEWCHVAFTFDTYVMKLYINGVLAGTTTASGTMQNDADKFTVGYGWFDAGVSNRYGYFYGSVDELAYFAGTALTQAEVIGVQLAAVVDPQNGMVTGALNGSVDIAASSITEDRLSFDVATQVELDAHIADTVDAHDASAISYAGGTGMSATDVEAAIDELANEKINSGAAAIVNADVSATAGIEHHKLKSTVTASNTGFTLDGTMDLVTGNANSASYTITLPAAASHAGRIYTVKKIDASVNTVTLDGNASETIDGAATYVLGSQWESVTIVSDGTNWLVVHAYAGTPL